MKFLETIVYYRVASGQLYFLSVLVMALFSCITTTRAEQTDLSLIDTGKEIFNRYCYQCHGYMGNANTLASIYLNPKPRDFTAVSRKILNHETMIQAVKFGRPGTAMTSFSSVLSNHEIESVVEYIRSNLMVNDAETLQYHTAENGWSDHERFAIAFPFVTGELSLDIPWEKLSESQRGGKILYLTTCSTCHDQTTGQINDLIWEIRSVSYPRRHYSNQEPGVDVLSGASIHVLHEQPVSISGLTEQERYGRELYMENCAFCHAQDGSARNWIGSFLEPRPRDFTQKHFVSGKSRMQLKEAIKKGLPGTSMPAWEKVLNDEQVDAIIAFMKAVF